MMLSYSSHGWSVGFSTDSTQNMGYAASLSALGNVNQSDSSTTQSAIGSNIQLTVKQGEVPTALSRDTQNANAKTERFDITEARERQEMAQVIGEIANNSVAIALKPRLDKAEQDKKEAQRRLDKNPNDAQAQAQLAQANTVIAQYGQGSDIQMAVRAVTGVLQGIATGNVGQAVVGGLSPYANKLIREATTDQSGQVNKEANLMAHALLGAIEAYATGKHAGAGAAGAVTGELAAELIIKQLYDKDSPDELTEAQKQTVTALSQLASGLAGGLVGDSTSSAISAAEIGKRAVENNALANRYGVQSLNDRELALYTKLKEHGVEDVDHYAEEYANAKTEQEKEHIRKLYKEATERSDAIVSEMYRNGELSEEDYDLFRLSYADKMRAGAMQGDEEILSHDLFSWVGSLYESNARDWSPLGIASNKELMDLVHEQDAAELRKQGVSDTVTAIGNIPWQVMDSVIASSVRPEDVYDLLNNKDLASLALIGLSAGKLTSPKAIQPKISTNVKGIPVAQDFRFNSKKKVNSASPGDIVRTPTSHPDDFTQLKGNQGWKNKYTGEIWKKVILPIQGRRENGRLVWEKNLHIQRRRLH